MAKTHSPSKKSAIVQAATKLFIKNGVAATTMREVAALAKVDQPLIHYYFPKADLLYQEVIEEVGNHLLEASGGAASVETEPLEILTTYLTGTIEWPQKNPGLFSIWIYFYYLASFNPVFSDINKKYRDVGRERIGLFIYKGLEAGIYRLPAGARVSDIALSIQSILTGYTIIAATETPVDWTHMRLEMLKACFRLLGVETPPNRENHKNRNDR